MLMLFSFEFKVIALNVIYEFTFEQIVTLLKMRPKGSHILYNSGLRQLISVNKCVDLGLFPKVDAKSTNEDVRGSPMLPVR